MVVATNNRPYNRGVSLRILPVGRAPGGLPVRSTQVCGAREKGPRACDVDGEGCEETGGDRREGQKTAFDIASAEHVSDVSVLVRFPPVRRRYRVVTTRAHSTPEDRKP